MNALRSADLTLNQVLEQLGYEVVNEPSERRGLGNKHVRKDGKPVKFPEGTIPGRYAEATNLESTTADRVWNYLRATGEIS